MRNDFKHVALEKIRETLNLLRESNLGANSLYQEDSLVNRLKSLQNILRYNQKDVIDPFLVVDPFLAILRAPYLAGPFKLVALDALQTFTSCNIFSETPDSGGETLAKVVDAVTRCKFVQTDARGDELVQLQIIHTLSSIIRSPVSCYLIDATAWDIISASHSILIHIATTGSVKSSVYQAAEKTIIEASRLVFASAGKWITLEFERNFSIDLILSERQDLIGPSSACAVKVLKFFVGILQKFCTEGKGTTTGPAANKRSQTTSAQGANGSSSGMGNSAPRLSISLGFGTEPLSPEIRELLFALKAVHAIFLAEGDLHSSRALISNHEPLASLVRDDLGRCLILLCSRRDLPAAALQSSLCLFSLTVQLMGPRTRILVECFMKFIYIKAILQVRVMFASHDESMRIMTETQTVKEATAGSSPAHSLHSSPTSFSIAELELILESLADLLADLGFLPSLFASFDCDPSKGDIVQPLVKYLGACMRYTLVTEPSDLNLSGLQEIGILVEQCYAQLCITFNQRDGLRATSNLTIVQPPTASVMTAEENEGGNVNCNGTHSAQRYSELNKVAAKLRLTRLAKGILAEAALKFSNKPSEGLKFLQSQGVLPTPLTPASVAKFLRIAPGLPNECTGSFLGELGKDNPSYEADGKAFHREVLLCYVRSFELKGQTVLNCMRIFLSAFRLPGEAQQIDRILVAFSEYCHGGSVEGNSGLLENPEVTYLLTFSMIMLNTDLHNPNVRADRKMTIAQFIKNNSFYGQELNQTRHIPNEYLETVYASLAQVPLRTERNDLNASITPEMWMDLQLQAAINTDKGLMLFTSFTPTMIRKMTTTVRNESDFERNENEESVARLEEGIADSPAMTDTDEIRAVARNLLTDSRPEDAKVLNLCERFHGLHWVVDRDLLSCVFQDLFGAAVCPFVMHQYVVAPSASTVAPRATSMSSSSGHGDGGDKEGGAAVEVKQWRVRHASVRSLSIGIELSLLLLDLLHSNHMQAPVDSLVLLLVHIAGVTVQDSLSSSVLKSLSLIDFEIVDRIAERPAAPKVSPENKLIASGYRNSPGSTPESGGGKGQVGDVMMEGLLTSIASRAALGTLLLLMHRCPSYLSKQSWKVMWMLLALLRDCSLLPASMIVLDSSGGDSDLLPAACRTEFEVRLLAADRREIDAQLRMHNRSHPPQTLVKKSSSILSLQGLGEAIFGSSQATLAADSVHGSLYCTVPPRWDVGYEDSECEQRAEAISIPPTANAATPSAVADAVVAASKSDSPAPPSTTSFSSSSSSGSSVLFAGNTSSTSSSGLDSYVILSKEKSKEGASEYEDVKEVLAAFINLREMVSSCGIAQIVSDTRFYNEFTLQCFLESLVVVSETADGFDLQTDSSGNSSGNLEVDGLKACEEDVGKIRMADSGLKCTSHTAMQGILDGVSDALLSRSSSAFVSLSSVSWLENVLVETSLRNRERLALFWSLLSHHYEATIQNAALLTYPLERRVTSLFRLSARLISRDVFTTSILELFRLFVPSGTDKGGEPVSSSDDTELELMSASAVNTPMSRAHSSTCAGLGSSLMLDLSSQVSAGMWRVLTTNLEVLPTLSLSQWQVVFDVIAVCAAAGGYASIKAFESMAWLLHESRLQGEIPMFCIVGIRPLLCNKRTTISVSVGAIKLLAHLHSRLEVLFTSEDDYVQVDVDVEATKQSAILESVAEDQDSDTPLLWESCWTPILSAMAEGCVDSRKPVRLAASNALCAAILDRHVRNVPIGLMVKILGDIYITVILRLAEFLVKEKEQLRADNNRAALNNTNNNNNSSSAVKKGRLVDTKESSPQRRPSTNENNTISSITDATPDKSQSTMSADYDGSDEVDFTVMPLLCTICKVFADQIKRLSSYPTFDRLWLRLVHVFGFFLGAPYGFDHSTLFAPNQPQLQLPFNDELPRTVAAAGDHLATLINMLIKSGVFLDRKGLWAVTKDSLTQMKHRPSDLPLESQDDLTPSSHTDSLPELSS